MDVIKPNSDRYKAEQANKVPTEEKKVEKVVSAPAKVKKKSGASKLTDIFISEDAANVKSYIFMDVLVPAIKKAISDIVTDGIDMILYGNTGARRKEKGAGSKVSYNSIYSNKHRSNYEEPRTRNRFDYDDIIFVSRAEAKDALDQMREIIETFGFVTVADLYDMADLSAPYTANNYGWTSVRTADIVSVREGYIIKLPRAAIIE